MHMSSHYGCRIRIFKLKRLSFCNFHIIVITLFKILNENEEIKLHR